MTQAERTEAVISAIKGRMNGRSLGSGEWCCVALEAQDIARELAARLDAALHHVQNIEGGLYYEDGTPAEGMIDEVRAIVEGE